MVNRGQWAVLFQLSTRSPLSIEDSPMRFLETLTSDYFPYMLGTFGRSRRPGGCAAGDTVSSIHSLRRTEAGFPAEAGHPAVKGGCLALFPF